MTSEPAVAELSLALSLRTQVEVLNQDAETNCRSNQDAIKLLSESGLFAMTIPAVYGGSQLAPLDCLKIIETLSYADSAIGWSAMIYSKTAHLGAALPAQWAKEIYGVERFEDRVVCPITAGAAAPTGKAEIVDGGIVVSGRWAWGSGTHHADWIAGGTLVYDTEGSVITNRHGQPAVHLVFFEKKEVTLLNNWNPSGLRGTGSGDFEVEAVFVPEGRWTILGNPVTDVSGGLYEFPVLSYFAAAVAAVPLGIATRALDDFVAISKAKIPYGKSSKISTSAVTQLQFGQAEALVAASRQYLWAAVSDVWFKVESGEALETEDRRKVRLAACQATTMCSQAVDILYNAGGGTSLQADCSLQKHFRDIHAATQHRQVSPEFLRMAGAVRLDGEGSGAL